MKSIRLYISGIILASLCLAGCTKDTDPVNPAPQLTTGAATEVNRIGATLSGSLSSMPASDIREYGIMVSVLQSMSEPSIYPAKNIQNGNFSVNVLGLEHGRTYYYCSYAASGATYSDGTAQYVTGNVQNFTTLQNGVPIFADPVISNIGYSGFDITASILDNGGSDIQMAGFIYTEAEGDLSNLTVMSQNAVSVFCDAADMTINGIIKDLKSGKRYAIRPYAVSDGVGYGKINFVTTNMSSTPLVSSARIDSVSVTASASILAQGTNGISEVGFCYSSENAAPTIYNMSVRADMADNFSAALTNLQNGVQYYVCAYAKENATGQYYYGEVIPFTPVNDTPQYVAVDLGLSVKWATFNVGATSPEEFGGYYAWGETTEKQTYTWANYKYCRGSEDTLTKYCSDSSYGFNGYTDNKSFLDPEDDVAHVKWGGDWRMPTFLEITELENRCTWLYASRNGVDGCEVIGPNGNSIFIPFAGARSDSLSLGGGGIWSGTPGYYYFVNEYVWEDSDAFGLFVQQGEQSGSSIRENFILIGWRCYGVSVRPVLPDNSNIPVTGVSFDQNSIVMNQGEWLRLNVTVFPANASYKVAEWTCDNGNVVGISGPTGDMIYAFNSGTAVITVTTVDGGYTAHCTVTVLSNEPQPGDNDFPDVL